MPRPAPAAALLLLLLPLILAPAASGRSFTLNHTAGATIRLGSLMPALNTWAGSDPNKNEYRAVMEMLAEDVNSGARAALLPNHTLELVFGDTTQDPLEGGFAFQSLVEQDVAAVVGPTHGNEMTLAAAHASTRFGVNLVGRKSQADVLGDKTKYPYYSRITGSHSDEALRVAMFMKQTIGWDRVGIFLGISTETVEFMKDFTDAAATLGVEIVQPVQFPMDALVDLDSMRVYLDLLRDSTARVILYLVPGESVKLSLEIARQGGMLESQYTMVLPSVSSFTVGDPRYPKVAAALSGCFYIAPVMIQTDDEPVGVFGSRITQRLYGEDYVEGQHPVDPYFTQNDYDAGLVVVQALDALVRAKQLCEGETPGATAVADCVALFAEGSDDVSLTRFIRSTPVYTGMSPTPIFMLPNGNRATVLSVIQFYNHGSDVLRDTDAVRLESEEYDITDFIDPYGAVTSLLPHKFQDGTRNAPLDEAVVSYALEQVSIGAYAAMSALAALASVFCVACVAGTLVYRNRPIMRMSSYRINCLSGLGGLVLLSPVFLGRLELSGAVCTAKIWLTSVGFTLLFAPMFAKLWRIYRIFGQKQIRAVKVTDGQLFRVVALLLLVDALAIGVWNAVAPQSVAVTRLPPTQTDNPNLLVSVQQEECTSDLDSGFYAFLIAFKACVLVLGSYLAYRTRDVKIKALNDSKWIGMSVYTTSLICLLTLPVVFLVGNDSADATYVLLSGPSIIVVTTATALLFVPKFAAVVNKTESEWTKSSGVPGPGTSTGAGTTVMTKIEGGGSNPTTPRTKVRTLGAKRAPGTGSPVSSPRPGPLEKTALAGATAASPSSQPGSPMPPVQEAGPAEV